MKKHSIFFFSFLLLAAAATAQSQFNDPNAQVRQVSGFHGIKVSYGIEVHLTQGNEEAVAVSATDPEFRDKMRTEVENGILKIYYDDVWWKRWSNSGHRKLRAYVSIKQVDMLDAAAGSEIIVEGTLSAPKISMELSSGAGFRGNVDVHDLDVDQSSGSTVSISGKVANRLNAEGSSGSVFKGYDLTVENCDAHASSGAGVQVTVNKELTVHASSGGYIHFKGEGLIRDVRTSSGGSVSRRS